jgi:hypothetical protein
MMVESRVLEIVLMAMLSVSVVVLFVGMFSNRKIRLLGDTIYRRQ